MLTYEMQVVPAFINIPFVHTLYPLTDVRIKAYVNTQGQTSKVVNACENTLKCNNNNKKNILWKVLSNAEIRIGTENKGGKIRTIIPYIMTPS